MPIERLTTEQLAELEAKHEEIAYVIGREDAWHCVFRRPKRMEWKAFRKNIVNPITATDAIEALAETTVVFPALAEFQKLLERYPGIPEACSEELAKLAGFARDQLEK